MQYIIITGLGIVVGIYNLGVLFLFLLSRYSLMNSISSGYLLVGILFTFMITLVLFYLDFRITEIAFCLLFAEIDILIAFVLSQAVGLDVCNIFGVLLLIKYICSRTQFEDISLKRLLRNVHILLVVTFYLMLLTHYSLFWVFLICVYMLADMRTILMFGYSFVGIP